MADNGSVIPIKEQKIPSWEEYIKAMQIFKDDYAIVNHSGDPTISPFAKPRDYGQYSLTQIPAGLLEQEFKEKMAKVKKILITCIDKRVALPAWKKEGGEKDDVFILAIGGGVVQDGERQGAMEIIVNYLGQFKDNIDQVVAADHDHVCGAAKYFLGQRGLVYDTGVCGLLKKEPGCKEEKELMDQLIANGAKVWIDVFGQDKVVAKNAIVKEDRQDIDMVEINLESVRPLSVVELVKQFNS